MGGSVPSDKGSDHSEARRLARRLAALPEAIMREQSLLEYVNRTDPAGAADVLAEVAERGARAGPPYSVALRALVGLLAAERVPYERVTALYEAAKSNDQLALMRLLYSGAALDAPSRKRRDEDQRELTLGHRKTLARGTVRDVLARLLSDPEPTVIRILLQNPRITEEHVVRLAAQRPTDPKVQREIFRAPRWLARYRVKLALVLNPYTPSEVAVGLLGFLQKSDLDLIRDSPTLSTTLREAARSK